MYYDVITTDQTTIHSRYTFLRHAGGNWFICVDGKYALGSTSPYHKPTIATFYTRDAARAFARELREYDAKEALQWQTAKVPATRTSRRSSRTTRKAS